MSDIDLPPVGQRLGQGDLDRMVQRLQRATEWQATTATLTGEGRESLVVAVVDARGVLRSIDIPDVACRGDGEDLARDVVAAITAAREDVAAQLTRTGRLAFGDDAPEVETIAAAAAARSRAPITAEGGSDPAGTEHTPGPGPGTPSATPRSEPGHW